MSPRYDEAPTDLVTIRECVDWLNSEAERTGSAARYSDQQLRNWIATGASDLMAILSPATLVRQKRVRRLRSHRVPPNLERVLVSKQEVLAFIAKTGRDIARHEAKTKRGGPRKILTAIDAQDDIGSAVLRLQGELHGRGIRVALSAVVRMLVSEALRSRGALPPQKPVPPHSQDQGNPPTQDPCHPACRVDPPPYSP